MLFKLVKILTIVACLLVSEVNASNMQLFDVKALCRAPEEIAKTRLPAPFEKFRVEEVENPKYGHEEIWTLTDQKETADLEIKFFRVEIHQNMVQSIWFSPKEKINNKAEQFALNLARAGLDPSIHPTQNFVDGNLGFPIEILGEGDFFQCFEYHAGH